MPETLKIEGKMNFHLISPRKVILDAVADKVLLPTPNGPRMILKNAAPIFLKIAVGSLWIKEDGKKPLCYIVSEGCAEIRRNICSVLAWAVPFDEIDRTYFKEMFSQTEKEEQKMTSDYGKKQIQSYKEFITYVLNVPSHLDTPNF